MADQLRFTEARYLGKSVFYTVASGAPVHRFVNAEEAKIYIVTNDSTVVIQMRTVHHAQLFTLGMHFLVANLNASANNIELRNSDGTVTHNNGVIIPGENALCMLFDNSTDDGTWEILVRSSGVKLRRT